MSRSKEGKDIRQDRQTASESQSDLRDRQSPSQSNYVWGRESRREYPRRSTLQSESIQNEPYRRGRADDYGRGYDDERRRELESHYRLTTPPRDRSQIREDYRRRQRTTPYTESGYSRGDERTPYRGEERGRSEYEDRYRRRDYGRRSDYNDRYETPTQSARRPDYSRTESPEQYDRDYYDDAYNRAQFAGRPEDYGAEMRTDRPAYGSYEDRYLWGSGYGRDYLRCGDIMTRDVSSCAPHTPVRQVADMMEDEDVGSVPVVENGRIVGIVTDRDIVCRILAEGRDTSTATAADAMSQNIVSVTREDSILDAIRKMGECQVRRLPVVDHNYNLRGIVSMADIALEAERNQELADALERISQPTPYQSRKL